MREPNQPSIQLAMDRTGALIYRVGMSPGALPPVRTGDLAEGWDIARQAASASRWGEPRMFRFRPADDDPVDLALTDDDAACWAEAIDAAWGLQTAYGLSLCLRLLGLVTLLAGSPSLRALCPLSRAGATPDPSLLRAAATIPLSPGGQLDEQHLRAHLAHTTLLTASPPTQEHIFD